LNIFNLDAKLYNFIGLRTEKVIKTIVISRFLYNLTFRIGKNETKQINVVIFRMHIWNLLPLYYYFVIAWLFYLILGGNTQIILVSARIR